MINKVQLDIDHKLVKPSGEHFQLKVQTKIDLSAGIHGVFGGSGQGKSTFLQISAGLIHSNSSVVQWIDNNEKGIIATNAESSPCVYQSQEVVLFEHLSVEQNLDFVIKHSSWHKSHCNFNKQDVIDWCGIRDLLSQTSNSLSGGEKQRVGLARSLLSGKPVIILDEPFSALDWQNRLQLLQLIKMLNQSYNLAFILVSHSLRELAICSEHLINLEQGQIVKSGAVNDVIQSLSLSSSEPVFSRLQLEKPNQLHEHHLTQWRLLGSDQSIFIKAKQNSSQTKESTGTQVVTVEAEKVSLSLVQPSHSSMLNQMAGTIVAIEPFQHLILVHVDVSGQRLLSLISPLSYNNLKLELGQSIFAQFKAV